MYVQILWVLFLRYLSSIQQLEPQKFSVAKGTWTHADDGLISDEKSKQSKMTIDIYASTSNSIKDLF
jgi:hypothetical protein